MRYKSKHPLRFYFTAIAVLASALLVIFFTKRPDQTQNTAQSPLNPPETDISTPVSTPDLSVTPVDDLPDQSPQLLDAEIVPTLTLGSPAQYPMPSDSDPAGKLRKQYRNAISSGRWPDPTLQITEQATTRNADLPATDPSSARPDQPDQSLTTHIVKPGQSLSTISKIYYGTTTKWQIIYDANKQSIGPDPDKLKQEQELIIPSQ